VRRATNVPQSPFVPLGHVRAACRRPSVKLLLDTASTKTPAGTKDLRPDVSLVPRLSDVAGGRIKRREARHMLVRPYDHTPFVRHLISNRNHRTDNYAFPPQVFRREDRRTFSWFSCMMVPRPRGRRTYFCHLLLILHQLKCGGGSTRSGNSTVHREPERLKKARSVCVTIIRVGVAAALKRNSICRWIPD
jgi:hypothetical protein